MTTPLMMIGPGGDYVTRFDVKGDGLIKTRTQQAAGQDRDADSAGAGVAWGWLGSRRKKPGKASKPQPCDHFEHTEPAELAATYAKPGLADLQKQHAMLQAIETWLIGQQDDMQRLAAVQTVTEASMARPAEEARVRVIRWNGGTMSLPTPAPMTTEALAVPTPSPCHAFADLTDNPTTEEPPHPERSATDGQPEPHPEAAQDPHDDPRHPALARLFADDAGAGRSARRQQGHGLRARRSAHQKGLPNPGCEQGALFGAVA